MWIIIQNGVEYDDVFLRTQSGGSKWCGDIFVIPTVYQIEARGVDLFQAFTFIYPFANRGSLNVPATPEPEPESDSSSSGCFIKSIIK